MPEVLSDGMPIFVKWSEEELIGSALCAANDNVLVAALIVSPEDFRDSSLRTIWRAIIDSEAALLPVVCNLLYERGELDEVGGEVRLADLCTRESAYLYSGRIGLEANADLIHRWAEKRRAVAQAAEAVKAAYAAPTTSRTPIYDRPEYQGIDL